MSNAMAPDDKGRVEFHKAVYDYLKHFTTLSSGSILLLAVFLDRIFKQPLWTGLVGWSVSGFLLAFVASTATYSLLVLNHPRTGKVTSSWETSFIAAGLLCAWFGFFIGMATLSIFMLRNLAA